MFVSTQLITRTPPCYSSSASRKMNSSDMDPPVGSGSKRGRDDGDNNDQLPEKRIMSYVARMVDQNAPTNVAQEGDRDPLASDIGDKILEYHKLERLAEACLRKIQVRANFEPHYWEDAEDPEEQHPVWTITSVDVTLPEEVSSFFSNMGGRTFTLSYNEYSTETITFDTHLPYLDIAFVADTSRLWGDYGSSVLYEGILGKVTLTRDVSGSPFLNFQFPNRNEILIKLSSFSASIRFETDRDFSYRCPSNLLS